MDRETEAQIRLECLKLACGDRIMAAAHAKFVLGAADAAGRGPSEPKMDLSGLLSGGGGGKSGDVTVEMRGAGRPTVTIPVEPSDEDIEAMAEASFWQYRGVDLWTVDAGVSDKWLSATRSAYHALVHRHR